MDLGGAKTFSKTKENILLEMEVNPDNSLLSLRTLYCETREQYRLDLSMDQLSKDDELVKYFDSPMDIFQEISLNFDQLSLKEKGTVRFEVTVGRKKMPIILHVTPVKQEKTILIEDVLRKIAILQKSSQQEELMLKKVISDQDQRFKKLYLSVEEMQREIQTQKEQNKQLKQLILQMEKQFENYKNNQNEKKEEKQEVKEQFKKTQELEKKQNIDQGQFKEKLSPFQQIISFDPHKDHTANKQFSVNSGILKRLSNEQVWVNYILQKSILPGQNCKFGIQIVNSPRRNINLGVLPAGLFNKSNTLRDHKFLACSLKSGSIWRSSKQIANQSGGVLMGQVVRIEADLIKNKIVWVKRSKQTPQWTLIGQISIPRHMTGIPLFFTVTIRFRNQSVRLLNE